MKFPKHMYLRLVHNPHAVDYQPLETWLENTLLSAEAGGISRDEAIAPADLAAIRAIGEVWVLSWCPDTPVGSCEVIAATLERVLELAGGSEEPNWRTPFAWPLPPRARTLEVEAATAIGEVDRLLSEFRAKHAELHRQWTDAVGTDGYVKAPWRDRDNSLAAEYRDRLSALGYTGPLLPDDADGPDWPAFRAQAYRLFTLLRDRLVKAEVCLSCGTHTPGRSCQCENDE